MPKLSGDNIISDLTEKYGRRLIAISAITTLVKVYDVNLEKLSILGLSLPPELFNSVALALLIYLIYALIVNWFGDLAAFRLWFDSNNIRSQLGTAMITDKVFISGGAALILKLYALEKGDEWPASYDEMEPEAREEFNQFKRSVELYIVRLEGVGKKFSMLSFYSRIYIWFQSFILPILMSLLALYFLLGLGSIVPVCMK
jgi:hypothetical protein